MGWQWQGLLEGQVSTQRKGGWSQGASVCGSGEASAVTHFAPHRPSRASGGGRAAKSLWGWGGREERGGHPTTTAEAQGALPPLPQHPPPPGAQRPESPARGRSQAVNAPSRPVLPTGPSPSPHLKTLEWLHHGLDALLGRPSRQPPRRGQRLRKPGPVPATALPLFRETWKGSEDPKTEWLPSCLSGRQPRAATWRLLRRRRRRPRGPRAWPRPLSARDETGRGRPCA